MSHWEKEGMRHDPARGKLVLSACLVDQGWLDTVAQTVLENLRNSAEMSDL